MRVALCGPSGTGKTTLAKYISEEFNLPFIQGSASLIMDEKTRKDLNERFNYEPTGHKDVINQSSKNPEFGIAFQEELLNSRINKLSPLQSFVTDRSSVDNIAYFLAQCSHNATEEQTAIHIVRATEFSNHITHFINIRVVNELGIEDNGSRVTNIYFQEMMGAVFQMVIHEKMNIPLYKILTLGIWDLQNRKESIKTFLNG